MGLALMGAAIVSGVLSAAVGQVQDWGWWDTPEEVTTFLSDFPAYAFFGGLAVWFLSITESEEQLTQPTSERLTQVMARFEGLDRLVRDLAEEVQEMTVASAELEQRAKQAETLLALSREEKDAVFEELDRRDRSASRRDLLFFGAGVAAGVITNLVLP